MAKLSQKDYLKKYLSSDDKLKKKKKKKDKSGAKSTVKIIDDDEYGYNPNEHELDENELFALNEEAPQIVGVIDERAPSVIMKQEYVESGKWKKIGGGAESSSKVEKQKKKKTRNQSTDSSPPRRKDSPDNSLPRRRKHSSDESPPRKKSENGSSRSSPVRNKRRDSDVSPPRRKRRESSDTSPPRRRKSINSPVASPPRRHRRDSFDIEPLSRSKKPTREDSTDLSPPRRTGNSRNNRSFSNESPRRRSRNSPQIKRERRDSDNSPPRRGRRQSKSPERQRRSRWSPEIKREPKSPPRPSTSKMAKTLDGKVSGLQDAKTLKRENDAFKQRQEKMFSEMRPELSGKNAEIVIRDRRGRNKDFEREVEDERRKSEAEAARKKEYDRWGKGLKQIEDTERRVQEFIHEANKPLARMADDEDMRNYLKDQERLDDPMLEYMRKKKQEQSKKKGVQEKPKYQGQYPDNRFNIAPGYRWDGVDRSNGYEKKYFSMINSKISMEEDAYRYSTEDM